MDAESNEETTYEPLEDRRRIDADGSDVDATPPIDRKGALYVALVLAGIGFVLPYNRCVYKQYILYIHIGFWTYVG